MGSAAHIERRAGLDWVVVDDEVVVVDGRRGAVHRLIGSAAALWPVLDGVAVEELVADVAASFGMDARHASVVVRETLDGLAHQGLLAVSGAAERRVAERI